MRDRITKRQSNAERSVRSSSGGSDKPLGRFIDLIKQTRPSLAAIGVAALLSIGTTGATLILPLFMRSFVDGVSASSFASISTLSMPHIALLIGALLSQALLSALAMYLLNLTGQQVVARLRDRIWKKLLRLEVRYFDGRASGEVISRVTNDTAILRTLIAENISGFFTGIIAVAGAVSFMLFLDWRMTLTMLAAIPLAAAVMVPIGRVMRSVSVAMQDETANLTAALSETISEIRLVKSSTAEEQEYRAGAGIIERLFRVGLKEGKIRALLTPLMSLILMSLLVLVVGYGGVRVSSGALTAGGLVAFIMYLVQVIIPMTQIVTFFTQFQKARGATESILSILDAGEERRASDEGGAGARVNGGVSRLRAAGGEAISAPAEARGALAALRTTTGLGPDDTRGEQGAGRSAESGEALAAGRAVGSQRTPGTVRSSAICFDGVSFAYDDGPQAIRDMSFTLEPGEVTALVGPSGAGKTTIFSLLERFYLPQRGRISLDGVALDDIPLIEWRRRIGYVSQESPVMAGTIRENIAYGIERTPEDDEVESAARMAYADQFIAALPQGYETQVGERGVKLSGGQRQRIAIARALLRDPSILMLHEATSSLDSESEIQVQRALSNLMAGRTTLVIAHRLSTVVGAQKILVIERGRLTGEGTHELLLERHATYRRYAEHQLRLPSRERPLELSNG